MPSCIFPHYFKPDWHPDGTRLLCKGWYDEQRSGIIEVDLSDSSAILLRQNQEGTDVDTPRYSPDGGLIAFCLRPLGDLPHIMVMNADGSGERPVTKLGGSDPSWSADGRSLVYVRENVDENSPKNGVLWVVDLQGLMETQLTEKWPEACRSE
jgi:Tol biopolymer transport system component